METNKFIGATRRRTQKVYYGNHGYAGGFFHPLIRIAGKFLKDFDFNVGDQIEVNVKMGEITISKMPNVSSPKSE
ncbi:MAG: hypothetical protein EPN85_14600 [Bacteroidetes bacterium]|nr:MAG: hypothetical protein EPN85_14600 [Bacteroidota bacterium]